MTKQITVSAVTGDYCSSLKCQVSNSTLILYKIPRIVLYTINSKDERYKGINEDGVYMLFGNKDGRKQFYVGQAKTRINGESFLSRLKEHEKDSLKGKWDEVVIIIAPNDTCWQTYIDAMENNLCSLAKKSHRYKILNNITPSKNCIKNNSAFEEFKITIVALVSALGYNVFAEETEDYAFKNNSPFALRDIEFCYREAILKLMPDGSYKLQKGSKILENKKKSCLKHIEDDRKYYKNKIKDGKLVEDIIFNSPSRAINFVYYGNLNGKSAWKTKEGLSIGDYMDGLLHAR